jgi:hypothetical protein
MLAGKSAFHFAFLVSVPDLTICAVAVPAVIPKRDCFHLDELETTEQFIVLRNLERALTDLDLYEPVEAFEKAFPPFSLLHEDSSKRGNSFSRGSRF